MFANMSINTGKLITTDAYRYLKSGQYKNLIELEKIPYSDIDISTIADGYLYKNTTL